MGLTKSQIKAKITNLNKEKTTLNNKLKSYKYALSAETALSLKLKNCLASLNNANLNMKTAFSIMDKGADGGMIKDSKIILNRIIKNLGSVKSTIETDMEKLKSDITTIEGKITSLNNQYNKAPE